MKQLSKKQTFFLGILLFSMFFGSGNLIFPPFMGYQAGNDTFISLLGFSITAIIFPILGIITIAKAGNLNALASRVSKKFAMIFTIIIFLSLGPGLVIPRNAAVSFEMAIVSFIPNPSISIRIIYALIFFTASYFLSLHPEKLLNWLGRILGPILLMMMLVVSIACILKVDIPLQQATGAYMSNQFMTGFMDGYNTMDTLAALNFGAIIALNVKNKGVTDHTAISKSIIHSGWIAGIFLFIVYLALAFVGANSAHFIQNATNGATVLSGIVSYFFGTPGLLFLGLIYVLSCLTTGIGLLCSTAEFFSSISKISYKTYLLLFSISGFAFSIIGLDQIISISVPFLCAVYPISMVLVLLGLFDKKICQYQYAYAFTITPTIIISIIYGLSTAGISIPYLTHIILSIPPTADLCWLIPACIGLCTGIIISNMKVHITKSNTNLVSNS